MVRATVGDVIGRARVLVVAAMVSSVNVTIASANLIVGDGTIAAAVARDSAGDAVDGMAPAWRSRNPAIARVDAHGNVTGLAKGRATIVATIHGISDSVTLRVRATSSEPSYSSATDKLLVRDDFESYSGITTGDLPFTRHYPAYRALGDQDQPIPLDSVVSLTTGHGDSGHALRLTYGGSSGASDIIVGPDSRLERAGQLDGTLPEVAGPYTHFYFTTWIRFSPGADPAGYDASGVKGIMLWHTGNQRYQAAPHRLIDYSGDSDFADTRWDVGPPHPPNATTHLNHWKTADGAAPHFSAYTDGNWHRFTVEMYATDDPAGHRGERLWLDGVLMFDNVDNVGDLSWGTDYDYSHPVTHFMVFGNYIRGSIAALSPLFTVDFDDWTAWTN